MKGRPYRDLASELRAIDLAEVLHGDIAEPGDKASFLENIPENAGTLALAAAWLGDPASPHRAGD